MIALSICEEAIIVADEKNTSNRIPFISATFERKCWELLDFFKEIGIKYYLDNPIKQAKVKEYEHQIDQMVYKLYDLTKEEIAIVEQIGVEDK